MLGTIYLGTSIAGWILYGISSTAMASRLKREGFELVKSNKSKAETLVDLTKTLCIMLLPGINLLIGAVAIFKFEELYDDTKKTWIKKGKVIKKDETVKQEEKVDIDLLSKDNNNPRRYSELSNEQKLIILEEEKARLLRTKENTSKAEPYNYKGAYRK